MGRAGGASSLFRQKRRVGSRRIKKAPHQSWSEIEDPFSSETLFHRQSLALLEERSAASSEGVGSVEDVKNALSRLQPRNPVPFSDLATVYSVIGSLFSASKTPDPREFRFEPPARCDPVGSHLFDVDAESVDLAVEMPAATLDPKVDLINFSYFNKRGAYAAEIWTQLCGSLDKTKYNVLLECVQGDPLRPVVVVYPLNENSSDEKPRSSRPYVKIFPVPPPLFFREFKLAPSSDGNIRLLDGGSGVSSVNYNNAILEDQRMRYWSEKVKDFCERIPSFCDALRLLRLWRKVRWQKSIVVKGGRESKEFHSSFPLSNFSISICCLHVAIINFERCSRRTPFCLFKETLKFISETNFSEKDKIVKFGGREFLPRLSSTLDPLDGRPRFMDLELREQQSGREPIPTFNVWGGASSLALEDLQHEARKSVRSINKITAELENENDIARTPDPGVLCIDLFKNLFLKNSDPEEDWYCHLILFSGGLKNDSKLFQKITTKSDEIKIISNLPNVLSFESSSLFELPTFDMGQHFHLAEILTKNLRFGLTDRLATSGAFSIRLLSSDKRGLVWHSKGFPSMGLFVGIRLCRGDGQESTRPLSRLVDRFTENEDLFKRFWGEDLAVVRRFQDGSICRSVVWKSPSRNQFLDFSSTDHQIPSVPSQIIKAVLRRHFSANFFLEGRELEDSKRGEIYFSDAPFGLETKLSSEGLETEHFELLKSTIMRLSESVDEELPLSIESFRFADFNGVLSGTATPASGPSGRAPSEVACVIQFVKSGGWPAEIGAIKRIKGRLLLAILKFLKKSLPRSGSSVRFGGLDGREGDLCASCRRAYAFATTCQEQLSKGEVDEVTSAGTGDPFIEVTFSDDQRSSIFRVFAFHPLEHLQLCAALTDPSLSSFMNLLGSGAAKKSGLSLGGSQFALCSFIEDIRRLWWRPRFAALLQTAVTRDPNIAAAIKLVKLWTAVVAKCPLEDFNDFIEHLCLLIAEDCRLPIHAYFFRFFSFISTFPWGKRGLFLSLEDDGTKNEGGTNRIALDHERRKAMYTSFALASKAERGEAFGAHGVKCPFFWISTAIDPHSQLIRLPTFEQSKFYVKAAKEMSSKIEKLVTHFEVPIINKWKTELMSELSLSFDLTVHLRCYWKGEKLGSLCSKDLKTKSEDRFINLRSKKETNDFNLIKLELRDLRNDKLLVEIHNGFKDFIKSLKFHCDVYYNSLLFPYPDRFYLRVNLSLSNLSPVSSSLPNTLSNNQSMTNIVTFIALVYTLGEGLVKDVTL